MFSWSARSRARGACTSRQATPRIGRLNFLDDHEHAGGGGGAPAPSRPRSELADGSADCSVGPCMCTQFLAEVLQFSGGFRFGTKCIYCTHEQGDHEETGDDPLTRRANEDAFIPDPQLGKLSKRAKELPALLQLWVGTNDFRTGSTPAPVVEAGNPDVNNIGNDPTIVKGDSALEAGVCPTPQGWLHPSKSSEVKKVLLLSLRSRSAPPAEPWTSSEMNSTALWQAHGQELAVGFAKSLFFAQAELSLCDEPPSPKRLLLAMLRRELQFFVDFGMPLQGQGPLLPRFRPFFAFTLRNRLRESTVFSQIHDSEDVLSEMTADLIAWVVKHSTGCPGGDMTDGAVFALLDGVSATCKALDAEIQRYNRADEIRITERHYLDKLQHLVQCTFAASAATHHIPGMFLAHQDILKLFDHALDTWDCQKPAISLVFSQDGLHSKDRLRILHTLYKEFLGWQEQQSGAAWLKQSSTAQSLVYSVTTRIQRYEMLFSELIKHTPAAHPDRPRLLTTLDDLRTKMRETNDSGIVSRLSKAISDFTGEAARVEFYGRVSLLPDNRLPGLILCITTLPATAVILLQEPKVAFGRTPTTSVVFVAGLNMASNRVRSLTCQAVGETGDQFELSLPGPVDFRGEPFDVLRLGLKSECSAALWVIQLEEALARAQRHADERVRQQRSDHAASQRYMLSLALNSGALPSSPQ